MKLLLVFILGVIVGAVVLLGLFVWLLFRGYKEK